MNYAYEIRICDSCGLRYPLASGHPFGTRCPACLGETRVVVRRAHNLEPGRYSLREEKHPESEQERGKTWAVLLDNIRSAWNVGSILRSADGFGFGHAFLCGITPTADHEAVTKTALGAEDSVPWSYHKDAVTLVKGLKTESWTVYALEEHEKAVALGNGVSLSGGAGSWNKVLILGNETSGVDPDLLDLCEEILYIPMYGEKRSFNVAIAFGIAAYALTEAIA